MPGSVGGWESRSRILVTFSSFYTLIRWSHFCCVTLLLRWTEIPWQRSQSQLATVLWWKEAQHLIWHHYCSIWHNVIWTLKDCFCFAFSFSYVSQWLWAIGKPNQMNTFSTFTVCWQLLLESFMIHTTTNHIEKKNCIAYIIPLANYYFCWGGRILCV